MNAEYTTDNPENTIAFQGMPGANSDLACRSVFPNMETLPCYSFEDAFGAVHDGRARLAMIPIDNSVAGRVADIHHLLPDSGLFIVGEHFQRICHHLLAVSGSKIDDITHIHSHVHALNQCRGLIKELGVEPVVHADTAGAAQMIAQNGDKTQGAIASKLAAEIYGLDILRENIEDAQHNTTRFLIMSLNPKDTLNVSADSLMMTSFVFRVKNIPAALYKALGGFASNGINMTKLESYLVGGSFQAAQFYAEVEGDPADPALERALDELKFFTHEIKILGTFPASPERANHT
ncbi:MAG: prephenate dehydratase [Rhodospirillaceae bacterium]|nr:prephenate dehydratase [Rhodospirillaceae bacterium]